jgi:GTP-binding protein Era
MAEDVPQGTLLNQDLPPGHRSGFVALVGKPNVGKSTLMNAWLGLKVAAVSPRPQTTRSRLLGIYTLPEAQVIFVDTPGIHLPHSPLQEYMVAAARRAIPDADLALMLADLTTPPTEGDRAVAELALAQRRIPAILALNKVDLVDSPQLAARRAAYEALGEFAAVAPISALTGVGCTELLHTIIAYLPPGPRFYPEEQVTDQQERSIAGELIREQAMRLLAQELPHAVAVMVDEFKDARPV